LGFCFVCTIRGCRLVQTKQTPFFVGVLPVASKPPAVPARGQALLFAQSFAPQATSVPCPACWRLSARRLPRGAYRGSPVATGKCCKGGGSARSTPPLRTGGEREHGIPIILTTSGEYPAVTGRQEANSEEPGERWHRRHVADLAPTAPTVDLPSYLHHPVLCYLNSHS
jgi:hypothetical protein